MQNESVSVRNGQKWTVRVGGERLMKTEHGGKTRGAMTSLHLADYVYACSFGCLLIPDSISSL